MIVDGTGASWLLLLHQQPAKPAYARVKAWRRLQGLGAVAVRNGVYALPASDEAREDFDWLRREIIEDGGDAFVCEARWLGGLDDQELQRLFSAARDQDYAALAAEARAAFDFGEDAARSEAQRLRGRLAAIAAIDFFGAGARAEAEGLVNELETRVQPQTIAAGPRPQDALAGKRWVTRAGVRVDRIASGWLIRRFIDPRATFRFVAANEAPAAEGEVRFDMFSGEFTHIGDRCTFEVLVDHIGGDPALQALAEIVHDIDLKDGKFGRPEVAGVRSLIEGICLATADDEERMTKGAALFDTLYISLGGAR